ncbi:MAG: ATP synthase F1 subunit delta, partial [Candidatus Eremiobacteraeota bacterium]|nr:ATP synthase F1 subunit delta [Candidatus Eremiobacteraeota bacterium]
MATFSLAKDNGRIDEVGGDLRIASDALAKDDDARRFFVSPVIDRAVKSGIVMKTFGTRLDEIALHLLLLLIRKRREAILGAIVAEYEKLVLADRGFEPLEIVSARELQPSELNELVDRLSRAYKKRFEVQNRV